MSEPDPNATSASTTDSTLAAIEGAQGPRLNVLVAGDSVFSTHALPSVGTATLGRSADNDVAIDNASISRVHARIHVGVPLRIEDAGSANGTWIRGRRLEPGEIVNLDVNEAFRLGPVTLIIQPRAAKLVTRRIRSHDYFENRVEEECSRAARTKRPVVVLQVVVDQAQRTAAQPHVGSALRESDVFAEYVPGTFEVLLLDADPAQVDVVTDRMRDTLAAAQIPARVARGIYPTDGRDAVALLRHVRAALQGDGGDGEVMQGEAGGIIVADDKMRAIHALVSRVARGDINVLLLGETGAGKEVVAEAVHRQSKRAGKPFLRLNCAAFTETLLESELFGHERGAFTGAHAAKQGLFEVAAGGTVFLDEVGELTPATQSKLLRVLDDRKVIRVGGVRPISARRAHRVGDQPRPRSRGRARHLPARPAVPAQRDLDLAAAAARARGRDRSAGAALHAPLRRRARHPGAHPERGRDRAPAPVQLARQHPRAAQHHRARPDPVRRGQPHRE
jgi:two-component system response regulator AtoC